MGDECIFVHFGKGTLHTQFGTIPFRERDYLIIPKGTIYRLVFDDTPEGEERPRIMVIETANGSHIGPPPPHFEADQPVPRTRAYCERDLPALNFL